MMEDRKALTGSDLYAVKEAQGQNDRSTIRIDL